MSASRSSTPINDSNTNSNPEVKPMDSNSRINNIQSQLSNEPLLRQSSNKSIISLSSNKSTSSNSSRNNKAQAQQRGLLSPKVRNSLINLLRIVFSTVYLIYIILTIPLSFELGGLNCGLSYSLTIMILYFALATLRVFKYHRFISSFLYYLQHLLLPTLLTFFLTVFDDDKLITSYWFYIINSWKLFLINSTPLFTILEGFCSLLSIQAIGQLFKYFIKDKSSEFFWSIINLILSSCILSTSFYFVGKIYVFPSIDLEHVGLISASLLGSVFTLTILITFYAIYFNRATTLESSLMVAYIVKCCYELFPELSKNNISSLYKFIFNEFKKIDSQAKQSLTNNKEIINLNIKFWESENFTKFNNLISTYFSILKNDEKITNSTINKLFENSIQYFKFLKNFGKVIINFIIEHFPRSFEPLWDFFKISISNLTFSILIQLAYRITVFFAATKIIPILSPMNNSNNNNNNNNNTNNSNKLNTSRLIYLYSPCIIIAVYTNLMIQYNYEIDKNDHLYSWIHNKIIEWFFQSSYKPIQNVINTTLTNLNSIPTSTVTLNSNLIPNTNNDNSILPFHTWQFWNWINIFAVLLLYFSELVSFDPDDSALTDHWN